MSSPSEVRADEARKQMSEMRLRMIQLQVTVSALNIELGMVQQAYSDASYKLWLIERGYTLVRDAKQLTNNDADRLLRLVGAMS